MSTTIGGVRIVDMPDLGVVTDSSSVVGEHSGSGRFGARAIRKYTGSGVINVLDYGATGNGVTDDTTAIQAAFDAVPPTGATVYFPAGTYVVTHSLFIASDTLMVGAGAGSILSASPAWTIVPGPSVSAAMIFNKSWEASHAFPGGGDPIIDKNITIEDLQFTWQNSPSNGADGKYSINLYSVRNVTVRNCVFYAGCDATYLLGCDNALVDGCSAYNPMNCAFDASWGPKNYRVTNCYAEMNKGGQYINFNGLGGGVLALGRTASGLVVQGCHFVATDPANTAAVNISTLAETEHCQDVVIANNIFSGGAWILGQGDIQGVVITGNMMFGTATNGLPAIMILQLGSAPAPRNVTVTNNIIIGPQTTNTNVAVIRVQADGSYIGGNTVTGNAFFSAVGTGANTGCIIGPNNLSAGTGGASAILEGTRFRSQSTDHYMATGDAIRWYDSGGTTAVLNTIGDIWGFYNTNASGTQYPTFGTSMRQTGAALNVYPSLTFGQTLANFGLCAGAAAGQRPAIGAVGTDTNVSLLLTGKGTGGALPEGLGITGPPTATDVASGCFTVSPDGAGGYRLYYNASGTLKSVALT